MINITLIIVLLVVAGLLSFGYKRGMAKQLTAFVAIFITACVAALLFMLISSFENGEAQNTIYSLVLLIILGSIYGIVKIVLRSVKAIANLPVISSLDKLVGAVLGFAQAIILIWILFLMLNNGFLEEYASYIFEDIENSKLLALLYENNLFLKMGM